MGEHEKMIFVGKYEEENVYIRICSFLRKRGMENSEFSQEICLLFIFLIEVIISIILELRVANSRIINLFIYYFLVTYAGRIIFSASQ